MGRRLGACSAVLGVLGLAWLPSEHIHSSTDNGRHVELVHRHFEAHHPGSTDPHVDHDGEDATYLGSPLATVEPKTRVHPDDHFVPLTFPIAQPQPAPHRPEPLPFVSVHDPPWLAALAPRGPPTSAV